MIYVSFVVRRRLTAGRLLYPAGSIMWKVWASCVQIVTGRCMGRKTKKMPYINDKKTAQIRNALAVILRASYSNKQESRVENTVRQVGRIDGLLTKIKGAKE